VTTEGKPHIGLVPAFIPPSEPVESDTPPTGKGWAHEVKFDGYRGELFNKARR
jgi:bifunctional non-homologous end joining protein LigD